MTEGHQCGFVSGSNMQPLTSGENARGSAEHVVRQVFDDFFKPESATWRFYGEDVSEVSNAKVASYENAVRQIENAEKKVRKVEAERVAKFPECPRVAEFNKLRRPSYNTDLEVGLADKYALLVSSDLLPPVFEDCCTRALERDKRKRRLSIESKNFLQICEVATKHDRKTRDVLRKGRKVKSDHSISEFTASRGVNCHKCQRSIMRTELHKTILVAEPNDVKFSNFEPKNIYKRTVTIKNVSNTIAKFQLEPRSPNSNFSIVLESRSGDRENLAPGMHIRMIILFKSENGDDSDDRIVVRVQFGKPVFVIVSAYRDPPILRAINTPSMNNEEQDADEGVANEIESYALCEKSLYSSWDDIEESIRNGFSSDSSDSSDVYLRKNNVSLVGPLSFAQLECKKCFVGEKIVATRRLKNIGGNGRFLAMSEFDWNSMSIDDITTWNTLVFPHFAISPAYFTLKRNEEVDLVTSFFPDSRGVQVDKFYIVCDNLTVHPVELIGDGEVYEPDIVTFRENIEKRYRSDRDEEESCDGSINLGSDLPNSILESSFTVSNTSGLEIYYRWEKRSTNARKMRKRAQTCRNLPLDLITVEPSSGVFRPCSSVTFVVAVKLTNLPIHLYRAVLQLFLEDIPLAAIDKEYEGQAESCRVSRRLCETSRDMRAKEVALWARCTEALRLEPFPSSTSFESFQDSMDKFPLPTDFYI